MKSTLLFSLCFSSVYLFSCTRDNLPIYSTLDRLRVLALIVNTPEVQNPSAGTLNVSLDPYISDIGGSGNISLEIQSCLDPGVSLGLEPSCQGSSTASAVQTISVTAPSGQAAGIFGTPERTGRPSSGSIVVGLQIPSGLLSAYPAATQYNGLSYLITVTATSSNAVVKSFRRVLLSTKTANVNPSLSDILSNGTSLSALPSSSVNLSVSSSNPETYIFFSDTSGLKTLSETLQTTWFVSDGELSLSRTSQGEASSWTPPTAAPVGRKTVVVGVLRDGRGGLAILFKQF
jgi:hypothetical protein